MTIQDYRAESYKKIANRNATSREEAEKKKRAEQSQTQVNINPANIVSGGGQSAIRGTASSNIIVTQTINQAVSNNISTPTNSGDNTSNSVVTAVIRGQVSPQDYLSGRVIGIRDVPISGKVASKLARESGNPQTIRDDVPYITKGRIIKDKTYIPFNGGNNNAKQTSEGTQLAQNLFNNYNSSSNNGNLSKTNNSNYGSLNNSGNNQSNKKSLFEKEIEFVTKWETNANKRQQNLKDFYSNIIKGSPYRQKKTKTNGYGSNIPDLSFGEKVAVGIISLPVTGTIGFGESAGIIGFKVGLIAQGLLNTNPEIRQATQKETTRARALTPPITTLVKQTFDITKPEGVVNVVGAITLPSFINKGVQSAQELTFIGKTNIPRNTIVEPEIITGQKTFPSSTKTAPELLNEFENTPFQKPIKDIIGQTKKGGFSASPQPLTTKTGVQAGTSATPGLYIGPSLSEHFLKIKGEGGKPTFTLLPKFSRPTANYIITEVGLIPESIIKTAESKSGGVIGLGGQKQAQGFRTPKGKYNQAGLTALNELNKYFGFENVKELGQNKAIGDLVPRNKKNIVGSGKAVISPEFYLGKGEKEALVTYKSGLEKQSPGYNLYQKATGFKYYTEIEGKKVPIKIIEATSKEGELSLISKYKTSRIKSEIESSSKAGRTNISLYGSIGGLNRTSYSRTNNNSSSKRLTPIKIYDSTGRPSSEKIYTLSRSITPTPSYTPTPPTPNRPTPSTPSRTKEPILKITESYKPNPPNNPRKPNPITPFNTEPPKRGLLPNKSKNNNGLFIVEERRFGKFRKIGEAIGLNKAKQLGELQVKKTLGATFRILKGRTPIQVSADQGFYTKGYNIIQQNKYTLNARSEVN